MIRDYLEKSLEKDETSYTVYNASGWDTDEIAAVPQTALGVYTDGEGTVLTSQQGQGVTYVLVKNVPAMGYQRITFHPGQVEEKKEAFRIEGREIETPYYILNIDRKSTRLNSSHQR